MSFKASSVIVCGICIFFVFVDGSPVTDAFRQVSTSNTADFPENDRIISTETRTIWKMTLDDNTSEESDTSMNLNDDILAIIRQENISDESSSELQQGYVSRDLDEEEYPEHTTVPHIGYGWQRKLDENKRREKSGMGGNKEYRLSEKGEFYELVEKKQKRKKNNPIMKHSFLFEKEFLGTPSNPITDDLFASKIFLFKKDFHPSALTIGGNDNIDINSNGLDTSLKGMPDKGSSKLFLFDNDLPDPSDNFHHS